MQGVFLKPRSPGSCVPLSRLGDSWPSHTRRPCEVASGLPAPLPQARAQHDTVTLGLPPDLGFAMWFLDHLRRAFKMLTVGSVPRLMKEQEFLRKGLRIFWGALPGDFLVHRHAKPPLVTAFAHPEAGRYPFHHGLHQSSVPVLLALYLGRQRPVRGNFPGRLRQSVSGSPS